MSKPSNNPTANCVFVLVALPAPYVIQSRHYQKLEEAAFKIRKLPKEKKEPQLQKLREKKQKIKEQGYVPAPHNVAIFTNQQDAQKAIQEYPDSISEAGYHSHLVIEPIPIGFANIGHGEPNGILAQTTPLKEIWYSLRSNQTYKQCKKPKSLIGTFHFSG